MRQQILGVALDETLLRLWPARGPSAASTKMRYDGPCLGWPQVMVTRPIPHIPREQMSTLPSLGGPGLITDLLPRSRPATRPCQPTQTRLTIER
jgi:hypothetical protein